MLNVRPRRSPAPTLGHLTDAGCVGHLQHMPSHHSGGFKRAISTGPDERRHVHIQPSNIECSLTCDRHRGTSRRHEGYIGSMSEARHEPLDWGRAPQRRPQIGIAFAREMDLHPYVLTCRPASYDRSNEFGTEWSILRASRSLQAPYDDSKGRTCSWRLAQRIDPHST